MKKKYLLFFLFIFFSTITFSQKSNAKDVRYNLNMVSKNITSGIEYFNLKGLKDHTKRSKNAILDVQKLLEEEQCYNALELSNSVLIYLETALLSEELVHARTYLTKADNLIVKTFYEYDICGLEVSNNTINDLEQQESDLRSQQADLEQKAKEIKRKIAEQELRKKELFITEKVKIINNNIQTFNTLLKSCDCDESVSTINENETSNLSTKNIEQIKTHYLNELINISEIYLARLKSCSL